MNANNSPKLVTVTSENISTLEPSIVRAYKSVFNASAWREWVKCSNGCGYKSTFEKAAVTCPNCSSKVVDFYSDAEVGDAVRTVLARNETANMTCVVEGSSRVIAFVWGWVDSICNINEERLRLDQTQFQELRTASAIKSPQKKFFYTSEMGVVPDRRGQNIATALFSSSEQDRITRFRVDGILRTSQSSPMFSISQKSGYREAWAYNDADKRTLLIKNSSL